MPALMVRGCGGRPDSADLRIQLQGQLDVVETTFRGGGVYDCKQSCADLLRELEVL